MPALTMSVINKRLFNFLKAFMWNSFTYYVNLRKRPAGLGISSRDTQKAILKQDAR